VELDALQSSIAALSARMKRFAQQSTGGSAAGTGMPTWQTPKGGRSHISESQMSLLKSSLEQLSLNEENNLKLRLIDHELRNKEQ
jgi:nuclear pore complex protein Nup88